MKIQVYIYHDTLGYCTRLIVEMVQDNVCLRWMVLGYRRLSYDTVNLLHNSWYTGCTVPMETNDHQLRK